MGNSSSKSYIFLIKIKLSAPAVIITPNLLFISMKLILALCP